MTDQYREAFERQIIGEARSHQIGRHPLHPDVYAVNETTRRYESFKAGVAFARDHYAPKLTEKEAVEKAVIYINEGSCAAERETAENVIAALRAAGVRFKEEA
jgi:hypothetical protein